jgi:hypothetical protein
MGKRFLIVVVSILLFSSLGCAHEVVIYKRNPPPPLKVEVVTVRPNPRSIWVPGHWSWRGRHHGYIWISGHWQML